MRGATLRGMPPSASLETRKPCIVVASDQQDALAFAMVEAIAARLAHVGWSVHRADLAHPDVLQRAPAYDAVVVAAAARRGRHSPRAIGAVHAARAELDTVPAFLASLGDEGAIARTTKETGWRPTGSGVFPRGGHDHRRFLHRFGGRVSAAVAEPDVAEHARGFVAAIDHHAPHRRSAGASAPR